MKLVELLARELKEWPSNAYVAVQDDDRDHTIWFLESDHRDLSFVSGEWKCSSPFDILISRPSILASDYATAIVTRSDWSAERARIDKPVKNAEGWIRHRGGKCPVEEGVMVDVRNRSGDIYTGRVDCDSVSWHWSHDQHGGDIMAYRLHKPADQVDDNADLKAAAYDAIQPLQWRDRITAIDATTQALTTERAELVQKLASEGFALIARINDLLTEAAQKHEDMSDWRNWKKGDFIEMVNQKSWADMTDGKTYALTKAGSQGFSFVDDIGDMREAFERIANDYAKDFKWHSSPSA